MLTTIHITVRSRVPTIAEGEEVISHNSDYVIDFDFDEEWQSNVKTVYFVCEDGSYQAVVMSGNSCDVPMMAGEHRRIFVGVQAGSAEKPSVLKTTRPCCLKVKDSIADYLGEQIPDPSPSVYEQIIAMLNNLTTPTWDAVQNKPFESLGDGLEVDENGVLSAKGGTGGSANAVQYVEQTLTDEQKTQARENIGAGTSSFSGSYNDLAGKPTIPTQVTIDSTLKQSGQAADAKAVGDALQHFTPTETLNSEFRVIELTFATKLDKNQGTENAGKILGVGEDGNVIPQDKPTYTLPQATADALGGIKADAAMAEDTQPVRIGADGKLKTKPSGSSVTVDSTLTQQGQAADAKKVGDSFGALANASAGTSVIPEQRIELDNAMLVGAVTHVGTVLETNTDYKHTEKIKLNSHKSFQVTGKNTNGYMTHIALRYVTAYDADGKVISAYSLQNVAEASASAGRVVQMDTAVDSVVVSIYKPEQHTDKTFILPSVEVEGGGEQEYVSLKTEKLSGFDAVLTPDEVCWGTHKNGITDYSWKTTICTREHIKPFIKQMAVTSAAYKVAVVVFKNGSYVRTDAWYNNGEVYEFNHALYQYHLYIANAADGYMYDFDAARLSVKFAVSTPDILYSYNSLESKYVAERERLGKAVEHMMRRNYDVSYANAPAPIDLIAYTGNNQIVHPKVLYFSNKFGGHRYWMAYTPYPWAIDTYENPCIAYSDNGYEWTNIAGNPLDDPLGDGYNSDTHLVYVESTNTLEVWYRYVGDYATTPVPEIIYRQTSTDGINWTAKEVVINNTSGDYTKYLSPCILHDGNKYKMWVVNGTDRAAHYYEGADIGSITEVRAINLSFIDNGDIYRLWHMDIIEDSGKTVLLGMAKTSASGAINQKWTLFLATSDDNITYTTPAVVIRGNPYGWDKQIYRSSIVKVDGEYRIYYSAQNEKQKHGLGICTSLSLSGFVGKGYSTGDAILSTGGFAVPAVRDIASALAEKITAPTSAEVGQIIKVKSVDTSGKPTEWEAADLPSGGGGEKEWTKILETEVTEATATFEVTGLDNYTEFLVINSGLQNATSMDSAQNLYINDTQVCVSFVDVPKSGGSAYNYAIAKFNGLAWECHKPNRAISATNLAPSTAYIPYNIVLGVGKATSIKTATANSTYAPVSGKITIYGR